MSIEINFWAVLVAAIASMIVGFLWYGTLFRKTWSNLMGFTKEGTEQAKAKGMTVQYLVQFVGSLVTAYILAHFVVVWRSVDSVGVTQLPFWIWLGFVATVMLGTILWEGKSIRLYIINSLYWLVNLFVMTAILSFLM